MVSNARNFVEWLKEQKPTSVLYILPNGNQAIDEKGREYIVEKNEKGTITRIDGRNDKKTGIYYTSDENNFEFAKRAKDGGGRISISGMGYETYKQTTAREKVEKNDSVYTTSVQTSASESYNCWNSFEEIKIETKKATKLNPNEPFFTVSSWARMFPDGDLEQGITYCPSESNKSSYIMRLKDGIVTSVENFGKEKYIRDNTGSWQRCDGHRVGVTEKELKAIEKMIQTIQKCVPIITKETFEQCRNNHEQLKKQCSNMKRSTSRNGRFAFGVL